MFSFTLNEVKIKKERELISFGSFWNIK